MPYIAKITDKNPQPNGLVQFTVKFRDDGTGSLPTFQREVTVSPWLTEAQFDEQLRAARDTAPGGEKATSLLKLVAAKADRDIDASAPPAKTPEQLAREQFAKDYGRFVFLDDQVKRGIRASDNTVYAALKAALIAAVSAGTAD